MPWLASPHWSIPHREVLWKRILMKIRPFNKNFQTMTRDSYMTLIQSVHKWAHKEDGPAPISGYALQNVKHIILKRNILRVVSFLRKSLGHRDTEIEAQSFLWKKNSLDYPLIEMQKQQHVLYLFTGISFHIFLVLVYFGLHIQQLKEEHFITPQTDHVTKKSHNGVPGKKWGHLSSVFGCIQALQLVTLW